jgi:hypothetical protein
MAKIDRIHAFAEAAHAMSKLETDNKGQVYAVAYAKAKKTILEMMMKDEEAS